MYDDVISSSTSKKLRRLPHVFASVLELPFHSDADVTVLETSDSFRFTVTLTKPSTRPITDDHVGVRAHTIEIYPGVTKTVIRRADGGDLSAVKNEVVLDDLELWRFRLPASTIPELASAKCSGQELVVTVPKDHVHNHHRYDRNKQEEDEEKEGLGEGSGRLILVQ